MFTFSNLTRFLEQNQFLLFFFVRFKSLFIFAVLTRFFIFFRWISHFPSTLQLLTTTHQPIEIYRPVEMRIRFAECLKIEAFYSRPQAEANKKINKQNSKVQGQWTMVKDDKSFRILKTTVFYYNNNFQLRSVSNI